MVEFALPAVTPANVCDEPGDPKRLVAAAHLRLRELNTAAALDLLRIAIGADPRSAEAHYLSGEALFLERRLDEALACRATASRLGIDRDLLARGRIMSWMVPGDFAWMAHMLRGEFERAWEIGDAATAGGEIGDAYPSPPPPHMRGVWSGQPLAGTAVLVRCRHGLGDAIQFIRYAPATRPKRTVGDRHGAAGAGPVAVGPGRKRVCSDGGRRARTASRRGDRCDRAAACVPDHGVEHPVGDAVFGGGPRACGGGGGAAWRARRPLARRPRLAERSVEAGTQHSAARACRFAQPERRGVGQSPARRWRRRVADLRPRRGQRPRRGDVGRYRGDGGPFAEPPPGDQRRHHGRPSGRGARRPRLDPAPFRRRLALAPLAQRLALVSEHAPVPAARAGRLAGGG